MWQIPGAGLRICLSSVGTGETMTDLSRDVFRTLTGRRVDEGRGIEGKMTGWVLEIIQVRNHGGLNLPLAMERKDTEEETLGRKIESGGLLGVGGKRKGKGKTDSEVSNPGS